MLYGNFADLIDRDQKARAMSYVLWYGLFHLYQYKHGRRMSGKDIGCFALIFGFAGLILLIAGLIISFTGAGVVVGGPMAIIGYKIADGVFG
jgi:hypothetical protein